MILMAGHRRRQAASSPAVFRVRTRIAGRINMRSVLRPPVADGIGCTTGCGPCRTKCIGSRAGSSTKPRRATAKVEWHPGELYPHVGFIVTNLSHLADGAVAFYNKRGTCSSGSREVTARSADAALMPDVRRQRGQAPASCARLQSRQFLAHAGDARADQGLVADEHSAMVNRGISWRDAFRRSDPDKKVRDAIESRQTSAQYVAVRDFFAEFPSDANVVMFGDSQIAFADWQLLLDIAVANRGIYGDTTAGALLRVGSIIAAHPKCVVTMLGTGDLAVGRSVESTARDYSLILDRLTASGIEVIVQSTLLTEPPYSHNQKVSELNTKMRAACRSKCLFLDLDRIITPGSTIDGIHLRPNTYKKWAEELKPIIKAHCGGSARE